MSELPEIESIVYFLKDHLINRTIKRIELKKEKILVHPTKKELIEDLTNRRIVDFSRRGKFLSFLLDDESRLIIHPRMVGQLITCPKDFHEIKHTHFIMEFDNNEEFRYIDVRRFGKIYYLKKDEEDSFTGINKLGIEYNDNTFNKESFQHLLLKYRKSIKDVLLDQSIITGIGNIYADEILFSAKILPSKKVKELSSDEINSLFNSIQKVLKHYTEVNESVSYNEYLKGEGKEFKNMQVLRLYDSETCPVCGTSLSRVKISSRGTVYCPNCQR